MGTDADRDEVEPTRPRRPAHIVSEFLAAHPGVLYWAIALVWLYGHSFAAASGDFARETYLRVTGVMLAVFFVAPAGVVWSHLAQPAPTVPLSALRAATGSLARTLSTTFWTVASVGLGYWAGRESLGGAVAFGRLLYATTSFVVLALIWRYIAMIRSVKRADADARRAADALFAPALWRWRHGSAGSDIAWLRAHAWRMAATWPGAVVVAASALLGAWAYVGVFTP